MSRQFNPTTDPDTGKDRVYGGDKGLIHVQDGMRADLGRDMALYLNNRMKIDALARGARTEQEIIDQKLCPGCYMVVLFNMAVELAKQNDQSLSELGNTMAKAFKQLAKGGEAEMEHIDVVLDPRPNYMTDKEFGISLAAMLGPWSLGGGMP